MRTATSVAGGVIAAVMLGALITPGLQAPATAMEAITADELAVVVVGDGSTYANVAGPVTIQHIDSDGQFGAAVAIPTEEEGDQHAFTIGVNRDQAGALQQSVDRQFVTVGGYDAPVGTPDVNGTEAPEVLRVIARVDATGGVDTSTTLAGSFNERHVRGVVSVDGSRYWAAGHGGDSSNPLRAGVLTAEHGADAPTALVTGGGQERNSRVPVIHDGQLYVSSDRSEYNGINQVGEGLPTTAVDQVLIAAAPAGREVAHDFAFIGDHLYVTYTDGNPAIVRYGMDDADAWVAEDAFPGEFWGLTGREASDGTVLYATRGSDAQNELVAILDEPEAEDTTFADSPSEVLAVAEPNTAFRGVAFAPGFTPGNGPADIKHQPSVQWDVRVAGGAGNALSAVLGADTNPVASGTFIDPEGQDFTAGQVTSGDQSIVADSDLSVEFTADGAFTIDPTPIGVGTTVLIVTIQTEDGRTAESRLSYAVSAPLDDETALAHVGLADASAAYGVGDGHFLVADDDSNAIRLYGPTFGEPVAEFDFSSEIGHVTDRTFDLEAAARIDDTIYWVGSLGNSRSGNVWPHRDFILGTEVSGSGAATALTFAGEATGFRDALVAWDQSDAHGVGAGAFQFERATADGYSAEGPNSLNLEGAAIAPDGTRLWLGFRSPLVPVAQDLATDPAGDQALVIAIDDIASVIDGSAEIIVSGFFTLDLEGRAIRDITETQDGGYLIAAGSADDAGNFAIFGWTGDPNDAPVCSTTPLGLAGWNGSYESILGAESLRDGTVVRVLQDAGTLDLYGTETEAQDLIREFMKFPSHDYELNFEGAFTPALTLSLDSIEQGETVDVIASGFRPNEAVTFTLHSLPVVLGVVNADATGGIATTFTVPASVVPGAHTLTAAAASGEASAPLTVTAASAGAIGVGTGGGAGDSTTGALATTGAADDFNWVALAASMLLLAGAVTAATAFARRQGTDTSTL